MALVTVTYNAWDHNQDPVPSSLQPELWFRPLATSYAAGLMTSREVKGSLSASGAGSVRLESQPGLLYMPVLRWLSDPSQADEDIENRARAYDEWEPFYPGGGGDISELDPAVGLKGVLYGYGRPPERLDGVVYLDIGGTTGVGVGVYGPDGAYVEGD